MNAMQSKQDPDEKKPEYDRSRRIIVEGPDDLSTVSHLWDKLMPEHKVPFAKACGGIKKLQKTFDRQISETETEIVGIVVDADENVDDRYREVLDKLEKLKVVFSAEPPKHMPREGLVLPVKVENKKIKRLGIWIMPDNVRGGAIEDFLLDMLPDRDDLRQDVEESLHGIESKGTARYRTHADTGFVYKDADHKKAYVATWLAWQEKPRMLYGDAITKGLLDPGAATCQRFAAWLRKLFLEC